MILKSQLFLIAANYCRLARWATEAAVTGSNPAQLKVKNYEDKGRVTVDYRENLMISPIAVRKLKICPFFYFNA